MSRKLPNYKRPTFVKEAILGELLAAPLLHIGVNAVLKGVSHSRKGKSLLAAQTAAALRRGMVGHTRHPSLVGAAKTVVGPEVAVPGKLGEYVGRLFRAMPKGKRYRKLKKLRKALASSTLSQTEYGRNLIGGLSKVIGGKESIFDKLPSVPASPIPHREAKELAGRAAAAATLLALSPHTGYHVALNAIREGTGKSLRGLKFFASEAKRGFEGKLTSRRRKMLQTYLLSPQSTMPNELAHALRKAIREDPEGTKRLLGTIAGITDINNPRRIANFIESKLRKG